MLSFLDEVTALDEIKRLFLNTSEAKIAVAFWGEGAIEALGLDRPNLSTEVICNLDSGACNPMEIRKLRDLGSNVSVSSAPKLHGKVYWTPAGVIIGSSNASTNGLAVEAGLGGWIEANIISDDPAIVAAAASWFVRCRENSYEVEAAHIELAEALWSDRTKIKPTGLPLARDLGSAVRASPSHRNWGRVKLAIHSEDMSSEGKAAFKAETLAAPNLRGMDVYEEWHKDIVAGDWLLDFDIGGREASFGGYWNVPSPKIESRLLTYVHQKSAVRLPGFGKMKLSNDDLENLRKAAHALTRNKRGKSEPHAMVPLTKALAFIDQLDESPIAANRGTARAFEQAMLNIYKEATKIGYRPTAFMRMINENGALIAAKRLLMSDRPSAGFAKLWELSRLDLTVEHLALQKPWRHLFSQPELDRAQNRLDQHMT